MPAFVAALWISSPNSQNFLPSFLSNQFSPLDHAPASLQPLLCFCLCCPLQIPKYFHKVITFSPHLHSVGYIEQVLQDSCLWIKESMPMSVQDLFKIPHWTEGREESSLYLLTSVPMLFLPSPSRRMTSLLANSFWRQHYAYSHFSHVTERSNVTYIGSHIGWVEIRSCQMQPSSTVPISSPIFRSFQTLFAPCMSFCGLYILDQGWGNLGAFGGGGEERVRNVSRLSKPAQIPASPISPYENGWAVE